MRRSISDESSAELRDTVDIILSGSKPIEVLQEEETSIDKKEGERLHREARETENRLQKEKLKSQRQDRKQRKKFSFMIFYFLCAYLVTVFLILFLSGLGRLSFELADGVLITLLSTTTVNMIGIFILVVKYLFPIKDYPPYLR